MDPATVIVQRNQGPRGFPGMPETGGGVAVPIKLLRRGCAMSSKSPTPG